MSPDNAYPVEIKAVPQIMNNGEKRWFTPAQSNAYYASDYSREGITIHWWGDGTGASNHDNIVNFFMNRQDGGSTNYVASDLKITMMVNPDNVAFTSQSGNPTTISIEHQPTLTAEGYKKSGWLVSQLEERYGRRLTLYPHKNWYPTQCSGTIDIARIRSEADKWASGAYNPKPPVVVPPAPAPAPVPKPVPTVDYIVTNIVNKKVRLLKDANLWDLHFAKYADAKVVKTLPKGTEIEVSATAKHKLGSTYYLSEFSFARGIGNGLNIVDCEDVTYQKPVTLPPPVIVPVPTVPPPAPPTTVVDPSRADVLGFLAKLVADITAFINKFRKG